jgi:hypothetical protein
MAYSGLRGEDRQCDSGARNGVGLTLLLETEEDLDRRDSTGDGTMSIDEDLSRVLEDVGFDVLAVDGVLGDSILVRTVETEDLESTLVDLFQYAMSAFGAKRVEGDAPWLDRPRRHRRQSSSMNLLPTSCSWYATGGAGCS